MAKKRQKQKKPKLSWKEIEALLRQSAKGVAELDRTLRRVFSMPPYPVRLD